jgi:hypothetical protein
MNRRVFIGTLAGGFLAAPLAAEAQQAGRIARVGYLTTGERLSPVGEAFPEALRGYGWVEGQNLVMEYGQSDGRGREPEKDVPVADLGDPTREYMHRAGSSCRWSIRGRACS